MGTKPLKNLCEIAVIGGGLAGLAAARHAARLGRLVTLFEGSGLWGGQVATVDHVDGLPIPGDYSGQDLAIPMLEEAQKVGIRTVEANVDKLEAGERLVLTDWEGVEHYPEAVIVASGASLRKLGVPGEEQFTGRGVSRCASCDGGFYRGLDVAVIGGGDAAVHEALVLARMSKTVHVICRSPLKAKREYIDRLDSRDNVVFHWDSEVTAIEGETKVAGIALRNVNSGAESSLECAGVFPFIGVEPNTAFLPEEMRSASGYAQAIDPRVIAIGAVRADYGGQAVQAMAEGVGAAEAAHDLLSNGVRNAK
ncbi:MAG: NAD(P)/FAD-dependent oxidoreductase [Novosphingobium sp.]